MSKLDWKPIKERAVKCAADLGHRLGKFDNKRPAIKMASCQKCYGCCWVAHTPSRGFGAGGRLLAYKCGTKEAAGIL